MCKNQRGSERNNLDTKGTCPKQTLLPKGIPVGSRQHLPLQNNNSSWQRQRIRIDTCNYTCIVFANASVSDPIAISSKSAALPGQTLRRPLVAF